MLYKVIKAFHDLQDYQETKSGPVYHEYAVGDTFPRKGLEVPEERITELVGPDNRIGEPLIEPLGGSPADEKRQSWGDDIEKMSKKELLQFAKDWGVKVPESSTKEQIREALVNGLR